MGFLPKPILCIAFISCLSWAKINAYPLKPVQIASFDRMLSVKSSGFKGEVESGDGGLLAVAVF